jgi:hypothetical protein
LILFPFFPFKATPTPQRSASQKQATTTATPHALSPDAVKVVKQLRSYQAHVNNLADNAERLRDSLETRAVHGLVAPEGLNKELSTVAKAQLAKEAAAQTRRAMEVLKRELPNKEVIKQEIYSRLGLDQLTFLKEIADQFDVITSVVTEHPELAVDLVGTDKSKADAAKARLVELAVDKLADHIIHEAGMPSTITAELLKKVFQSNSNYFC